MILKTFITLLFFVTISTSKPVPTKEPFKIVSHTVLLTGPMLCNYTISTQLPDLITKAERAHVNNKSIMETAREMIDEKKSLMNSYAKLMMTHADSGLYEDYLNKAINYSSEITKDFAYRFRDETEMKISYNKNIDGTISYSVFAWDGLTVKNTDTGNDSKIFFNIETMKPAMFVDFKKDDGSYRQYIAEFKDLKAVIFAQNVEVRQDCKRNLNLSRTTISVEGVEAQSGKEIYHYKLEIIDISDISESILSAQKQYFDNGSLTRYGQNNEIGEKIGEWKYYHNNGKLYLIGKYKNGKKTGEWKEYSPYGTLKYIHTYENGEIIGSSLNGELIKELTLEKSNNNFIATKQSPNCIEGDCINGYGTYKGFDGTLNKYEKGYFKNGELHGQGKSIFLDLDYTLEGVFENGHLYYGKLTSPEIEQYIGELKGGAPHGEGTAKFNNGTSFEGRFEGGCRAEGTYTGTNYTYVGTFKENSCLSNLKDEGIVYYSNGDWYRGSFKSNKRHGYGKYYSKSSGEYFTGRFENGEFIREN